MVEARGLRKRDVCAGVGQAHEDLHVVRLNLVAFPEVTKDAVFYLPLLNQYSLQIAGHLQTSGARGRRRAQAEREADRVEWRKMCHDRIFHVCPRLVEMRSGKPCARPRPNVIAHSTLRRP